MVLIEFGITTEVNPLHSSNGHSIMKTTEEEMIVEIKYVNPQKA